MLKFRVTQIERSCIKMLHANFLNKYTQDSRNIHQGLEEAS
jgi:hypothetical protein